MHALVNIEGTGFVLDAPRWSQPAGRRPSVHDLGRHQRDPAQHPGRARARAAERLDGDPAGGLGSGGLFEAPQHLYRASPYSSATLSCSTSALGIGQMGGVPGQQGLRVRPRRARCGGSRWPVENLAVHALTVLVAQASPDPSRPGACPRSAFNMARSSALLNGGGDEPIGIGLSRPSTTNRSPRQDRARSAHGNAAAGDRVEHRDDDPEDHAAFQVPCS